MSQDQSERCRVIKTTADTATVELIDRDCAPLDVNRSDLEVTPHIPGAPHPSVPTMFRLCHTTTAK